MEPKNIPTFNGGKNSFWVIDLEFFAEFQKSSFELDETQVWDLGADMVVVVST